MIVLILRILFTKLRLITSSTPGCRLSSVPDMDVGSAPVESTKTWAAWVIPMDWWPSPKDWPWFYASFAHGTYSFSSQHFMDGRFSKIAYVLKHVETCWNHCQQHCWYSYIRLWPGFTTTPAQSCAQKQLACSGWNLHRVPPPQRLSWQLAKSTTMVLAPMQLSQRQIKRRNSKVYTV